MYTLNKLLSRYFLVFQVYEELVNVRQTVTHEQDYKMQAELDLLKQKTGSEINQLRLTAEQVLSRHGPGEHVELYYSHFHSIIP